MTGRWETVFGTIERHARGGYRIHLSACSAQGRRHVVTYRMDERSYARWLPEILDRLTHRLEKDLGGVL